MTFYQRNQNIAERNKRVKKVNKYSKDGRGKFVDIESQVNAARYVQTGERRYLDALASTRSGTQ